MAFLSAPLTPLAGLMNSSFPSSLSPFGLGSDSLARLGGCCPSTCCSGMGFPAMMGSPGMAMQQQMMTSEVMMLLTQCLASLMMGGAGLGNGLNGLPGLNGSSTGLSGLDSSLGSAGSGSGSLGDTSGSGGSSGGSSGSVGSGSSSGGSGSSGGGGGAMQGNSSQLPVGAPTAKVGNFLNVARHQEGKPYVWGSAGPNAFDCSGLVDYALNQAGVKVPRLTADGYMHMFANSKVDKNHLQPGDLIFYSHGGSHATHVEIYIGNGRTVGAEGHAIGIKEQKVNWAHFIGAARVPGLYK